MTRYSLATVALLTAAVFLPAGTATAASYDDEGFFVFLDAAFTTPGNTDQVVGYTQDAAGLPQTSSAVMTEWGSNVNGKIGFGYDWASGSSVSISYWQFDNDEAVAAVGPAGGFLNFAIGPATYYDGYSYIFNYGSPGTADFIAELQADTIDVTFSREQELGDFFNMEWHVGLRYATFEERLEGTYDICADGSCDYGVYEFGDISFDAAKLNEADMIGFRAGARGTFFVTENVALTAGAAMSALQGTVTSTSGLTPTGLYNADIDPPSVMTVEDDARSGTITEFDVGMQWYLWRDKMRLQILYQFSNWSGLTSDLARNPPGLLNTNPERGDIGFAGVAAGVRVRF